MKPRRTNRTSSTLLEFINASEAREDDETFKNAGGPDVLRNWNEEAGTFCSPAV